MASNLDYALAYARKGLSVFPCKGKIPLTEHGFKDATKDEFKIKDWWESSPGANIGIACGKVSGITVLDIDPRNGGDITNTRVSNLPKTPKVMTGGGGCHLYFKYNGSGSGVIDSGLDLQSDGKYVIAPPSIHPDTNKTYDWDEELSIGKIPFAEAQSLKAERKVLSTSPDADIPKGGRNHALTSLAGVMRRKGASQGAIEDALIRENSIRCNPPLPEYEVKNIAKSISRYEPIEDIAQDIKTSNGTKTLFTNTRNSDKAMDEQTVAMNGGSSISAEANDANSCVGGLSITEQGKVKFISTNVADRLAKNNIIFSGGEFYQYEGGCYRPLSEILITKDIKNIIGEGASKKQSEEIIYWLRSEAHIKEDELNSSKYINLKNGLFDLETNELHPHTPDVYSTIQLDVNYNTDAKCDKWLRTLQEIFKGDEFKMETLQEFFGLCLTKDTKQNKALMCIGEGNNGKSVALKTLEALLGRENFSSIPLERFCDPTYVVSLFGKLANISIETHAKSEVYDSTFKAITSGDSIQAHKKFKMAFSFRPFCKLVFAMNNLPRVDDKTNAFFNRLLIIKFDREFKEEEQNKTLSQELLQEQDGIFLWSLEGLKNLAERGYFRRNEEMEGVIKEYRRENNNVLVFVDEECQLDPNAEIEKNTLYLGYKNFCQDNGYRALSKKRFGMEISKQYKQVQDGYNPAGTKRIWQGICTNYRQFRHI